MKFEQIKSTLRRITESERKIRDHISTRRYQIDLIRDLGNWNQICSCLDVVGDTVLSIHAYMDSDFPSDYGLRYIYTYGLLQSLFIQQDAMINISKSFKLSYQESEILSKIRAIRNAAIGHPTNNKVKKVTYHNSISRMSMEKWRATLLRSPENGNTEFLHIEFDELIFDQMSEIERWCNVLVEKLEDEDKKHKERFSQSPLSDIFHSTMGYYFEKVSQGINSPSHGNKEFGLSMLNLIEETYVKFREALSERREFCDYAAFDFNEYLHAIRKLKLYLSDSHESNLSETDARIFCFFIRERHEGFVKIAEEIDAEYSMDRSQPT